MMKDNAYLGEQPVGRLLFKLALPAICAQLINMLYNLVDRIYIGHIPEVGAAALTGVGVCLPFIMVVSATAALVSMGAAPRASISMGKKDNAAAERILGNAFVLLVALAAVLTAVILIWNRPMLMVFGASENTIGYASDYMFIYGTGTVFVLLSLGLNAFITAQGFAKTSMFTVLIGAVCNIALDPLFIFAFDMGVAGAALATVVSQAVSAVWVTLFLCGKKTILKLRARNFRLKAKVILPCLALGTAPFIMQATESVLMICFNSSLQKYGGDIAVGAMTILLSIMQFTMLPLQGFGQGAQPISGYNFGAGNADRVKAVFLKLLLCCAIYSSALYVLVMSMPGLFARIFTGDAALVAFTARAMRIYMAASCLMGVQIACQMTLISIGNSLSSVFIAVLRKLILLIPLIYILPLFMADKVTAIYASEPIADVIAVSITAVLFAFQFKKALNKLRAGGSVTNTEVPS